MALLIDTSPELEKQLNEEASRRGLSLADYARLLLEQHRPDLHLAAESGDLPHKQPLALYGTWRDMFPEEVDVDAALKEIRGEWLKEEEFSANG